MDDSSQMTAFQLRSKGAVAVTLMHALDDLDDVLRFGGRAMREYERRLNHARKLDEISRHTISLLDYHKHLANQVGQIQRLYLLIVNIHHNDSLKDCSFLM